MGGAMQAASTIFQLAPLVLLRSKPVLGLWLLVFGVNADRRREQV
jgi:hypothetical protein